MNQYKLSPKGSRFERPSQKQMLIGSYDFKKSQLIQTHGDNFTANRIKLDTLESQRTKKRLNIENKHVKVVKELQKQMSRNQNYMEFYQRDVNNILEEIKITDQINLAGARSKKSKRNKAIYASLDNGQKSQEKIYDSSKKSQSKMRELNSRKNVLYSSIPESLKIYDSFGILQHNQSSGSKLTR